MIKNFFKNLYESARLFANRIRIKYHELVTGKITRVRITDQNGKEQDVVVERELEKVCDHKTIHEIAPTMWKCSTPDCDTYFQIGYKVMLTGRDLVGYLDQIASHLKLELQDREHESV
jgi:hypothetical protein